MKDWRSGTKMIRQTSREVRNDVAQYIRSHLLDPYNKASDAYEAREAWDQLLKWIDSKTPEDAQATRADDS